MGSGPFRNSLDRNAGTSGRFQAESAAWRPEIAGAPYSKTSYFRTSLLMIVFMISLVPP